MKGLFLPREALPSVTGTGQGDAAYPRTPTACADVLETMGWTKAAFPVREGSFAEEVGFRAKRARAEEPRGWFLVVFFQRRC